MKKKKISLLSAPLDYNWRHILAIFLFSRLFYVGILLATPALTIGIPAYGDVIRLAQPWGTWLHQALFNSDSLWYWSIATKGYAHVPFNTAQEYNWAFFPLYPWLTRWIGMLWPGHLLAVGVMISNAAFFAALWMTYRWISRHASPLSALSVVLLEAFSPATPYFTAYRAAALFFFFSVASLAAMDRAAWALAVFWGILAGLTRPTGILLAVPYWLSLWTHPRMDPADARRWLWSIAGIFYAQGFAVLSLIDRVATGNPLAFLQIQSTWSRFLTWPFAADVRWLLSPLSTLTTSGGWAFPPLALLMSFSALLFAFFLTKQARRWQPLAWYLAITTLLANSYSIFDGIPRFIAELPPWYIGPVIGTRPHSLWRALFFAGFVLLMAWDSTLWALSVHAVQS
ncbi:MAG: hypothetical protein OWS74_01685 [Firmicutes bacterium]|nr:hypothetical protein [Bacillota bacterium]